LTLPVRSPVLEWAARQAAGELEGLEWVAEHLPLEQDDYTVHEEDGEPRFHAVSLAPYLPPPMAQAAVAAHERGEATALEGVQAMFARAVWPVVTRRLWWTADSPAPGLLAWLLEQYGIGPELHRNDPGKLRATVARLATWRRERGDLKATLTLLRDDLQHEPDERYAEGQSLVDEVLCCHKLSWWRARQRGRPYVAYRIEDGMLRFQDPSEPAFVALPEDVVAEAAPDRPWSATLLRLLPAWMCVRPVLKREKS
jgi:hypothetical protein